MLNMTSGLNKKEKDKMGPIFLFLLNNSNFIKNLSF